MTAVPQPGDRLERALALFLQHRPTTVDEAQRLLAEHHDLRDLLEPMLEPQVSATDDDAQTVLGDFRLVRELGRGGMGIVHEAWQRSLDRRVAVKVLAPALVASPSAIARFRREAAAAGRLRHPHIVEVLGFGSELGQHFFAMQFVDGQPLHDCAERFREPKRAVALAVQLASALAHAHQHGLVHRDVKPGNVLVRADDHALLTDFGVARDEALPSLTLEGGFLGTVDYASPEQLRGESVDARTDVWALGVVLHELLTGAHPFRAATPQATIQRVLTTEPLAVRSLPGVGDDLAAVVGHALEKSRLRRYASMQALHDDLQAVLDGRPVSVRLPTTGERFVRWVAREPWQATALLVLAVGAAVAGSGFLLASRRADENARLAGAEAAARTALAGKVQDYDLLAGVVLHERAAQRVDTLVPAWPQRVPALRQWLVDCAELEGMVPTIDAGIASLRTRSRPRNDAEREADRTSHPRFEEWRLHARQLAWLETCAAIRAGTRRLPPPELPEAMADLDAKALNEQAWQRVAPQPRDRRRDDEPELGLLLARLAVEKSRGTPLEAEHLDTLAWALLANGDEPGARAASAEATTKAGAAATTFAQYERNLDTTLRDRDAGLVRVRTRTAELAAELDTRRTFSFDATADQFLHDTLVPLRLRILDLVATQRPRIERRVQWAERVHALTFAHPRARIGWPDARSAIAVADDQVASRRYRGRQIPLHDDAVLGLVPIGCNPVTKLWEFYDLASAWNGVDDPATLPIPQHRPDGSIAMDGATGIVFVLLPGGPFAMGAQAQDADAANFDPNAPAFVGPVQQVELDAFLMARHEVTQGQWARLCTVKGSQRPSGHPTGTEDYVGGTIDDSHPVEKVTWNLARQVLGEHGMALPTEGQWEYGCRAGTTTPWWSGPDSTSLQGCANLYDQTAAARSLKRELHEAFADGHTVHAPVGSFRANPFGLFDMHGNVGEWCLDAPAPNGGGFRPGDGARRQAGLPNDRSQRGGSYQQQGLSARSSMWVIGPPETRAIDLGVRAVRRLAHD